MENSVCVLNVMVTPAGRRLQICCRTDRSFKTPLVHRVCGVKIKRQFEGEQEDPNCTSTHLKRGAIPLPAEDGVLGRTRVADGCMKSSRVGRWPEDQRCHTIGKMWTGWWWFKDTKENHDRKAALGEKLMSLELFNLKQT